LISIEITDIVQSNINYNSYQEKENCPMEPAPENMASSPQEGSFLYELLTKVKAVAQSSHAELFARIVDGFYEQITEEYFSPEDQADIKEGLEDIRQGRFLTLEEYRSGKRL
jgi:predicted transcriptional regulator